MKIKDIKESVVLEDGIEYLIVDRIFIKEIEYLFLTNINDNEDFCIRKIDNNDIIGLDNDQEFDLALLYFTKKHS